MTRRQHRPVVRAAKEELERQIRDHYDTWRDRPPGRGCLLVLAGLLLTTALAAYGLVLLVQALA